MYLKKEISRKTWHLVGQWRKWQDPDPGSGSISQRHGSADPNPDPHQIVMDPEHCLHATGTGTVVYRIRTPEFVKYKTNRNGTVLVYIDDSLSLPPRYRRGRSCRSPRERRTCWTAHVAAPSPPSPLLHAECHMAFFQCWESVTVRIRIRGSIPLTNGSGSNSGSDSFLQWLKGCTRIRIRTSTNGSRSGSWSPKAKKHVNPADPDPQNCLFYINFPTLSISVGISRLEAFRKILIRISTQGPGFQRWEQKKCKINSKK